MKVKQRVTTAILMAMGVSAWAAELSPGLWEISMETRTEAAPGFQPAPFSITQCIRAQDAANPGELLGKIANPGASACNYTRKAWNGNVFSFAMTCAGTFAMTTQGEVTVSATSFQGQIKADSTVAGERTSFTNKLNARRVGNC